MSQDASVFPRGAGGGLFKIRLLAKGFEKYTGNFGDVAFVEGISELIPQRTADRMSVITQVEIVEGEGSLYFDRMNEVRKEEMPVASTKKSAAPKATKAPKESVAELPIIYTREILEGVADKTGIVGLREIGALYGVKASSIERIIDGILERQPGYTTEPKSE